jgi:hypothetical protein
MHDNDEVDELEQWLLEEEGDYNDEEMMDADDDAELLDHLAL